VSFVVCFDWSVEIGWEIGICAQWMGWSLGERLTSSRLCRGRFGQRCCRGLRSVPFQVCPMVDRRQYSTGRARFSKSSERCPGILSQAFTDSPVSQRRSSLFSRPHHRSNHRIHQDQARPLWLPRRKGQSRVYLCQQHFEFEYQGYCRGV
jgi:hypothetical protein